MSVEQPGSVYPILSRSELKQLIKKELEEEGWTKPNSVQDIDKKVEKKKGKLRRCGKWLLCLPVVMLCCSGKFLCKHLFKCICSPCRCVGNCLCPCC